MNYLRGAVNAISAPYQYYKELPPINPATLTGAVDVIVVQRPTDSGGTELACTPFHVRFGKWQVLRPGQNKVDVQVNGHRVPFNMKIGEAGEAFFVFETDDDVPESLMTSPIIEPADAGDEPAELDGDGDKLQQQRLEPDFLDLDNSDGSTLLKPTHHKSYSTSSVPPSPSRPDQNVESELDKRADQALAGLGNMADAPDVQFHDGVAIDVEGYHAQGHHHGRERSDRTIRSSDSYPVAFPTQSETPEEDDEAPSDSDSDNEAAEDLQSSVHTFIGLRATSEPPPDMMEPQPTPPTPSPITTSSSQPNPNTLPPKLNIAALQEYSWDWGAFPQPSPVKPTFGKGGRSIMGVGVDPSPNSSGTGVSRSAMTWGKSSSGKYKTKQRMRLTTVEDSDAEEDAADSNALRSRSVPPEVGNSPTRRKHRSVDASAPYQEEDWLEENDADLVQQQLREGEYGTGGRLSVSKSDPTVFRVTLDGKKSVFELSLVSSELESTTNSNEQHHGEEEDRRGRRARDGSMGGLTLFSEMSGIDDFELSRRFEEGKITFQKFLEDESVVTDPRLVIRWAGSQYLTRQDESPLMRSLVIWREDHLQRSISAGNTRPSSPTSEDDEAAVRESSPPPTSSSSSQPDAGGAQPTTKSDNKASKAPTSSSWVQWWKRKQSDTTSRPDLKGVVSAPPGEIVPATLPVPQPLKEIPPAESAPAFPSTPIQKPIPSVVTISQPDVSDSITKHKYIKTLRLTSEQLKSLNLKPGANTITFALASTGTIACTARIFVWDCSDSILVSDIDGTITKSDGLGHVFAMIGRDWTHLGVAKLYTDICRNGYKIMYLTSRAIGQADATRGYLKGIKQNDYQLPEGPVIMSPDRLMTSLHREVILRKPEVFKMACLRDIQRLFGEGRHPFYAGFGNRITDALSYRSVNVPSSRIFTIDPKGEVKLELLELAGYKSSYIHMTDLVDQMFPPIHRKWTPEFTDFNYWKTPVPDYPLPDLSPPSPTLSARSDTSGRSAFARIRNFSLVSNRQANVPKELLATTPPERSDTLRNMSSLERLSSSLGFSSSGSASGKSTPRRSVSPESVSSSSMTFALSDEEDDDFDYDDEGKRRRRQRTQSMTSMPGSLDGMDLDDGDEHDNVNEISDLENGILLDEEAAFDEDLLATGEMKNVPFL